MKKSIPTPLRQLRREALALLAGSILESLTCVPGIVVAALLTGASSAPSQEFPMKIRLQVDGQDVNATLDDNATARDFAALLPLSLTLTDYARIERIAYLPCKLAPEGGAAGVPIKAGDIAYYAPSRGHFFHPTRAKGGACQLGRRFCDVPVRVRADRVGIHAGKPADADCR
jgi:hypothetical protein